MEYKVFLNKIEPNKKYSVIIFIMILSYIALIFHTYTELSVSRLIFSSLIVAMGILLLFDSFGFAFKSAYINIDNEKLIVRSGLFSVEQKLFWKNIRMIELFEKRILFRKHNGKITVVETKRIPEEYRSKLNNIVSEIAVLNKIKLDNNL